MPANGRYCSKSLFALTIKNFRAVDAIPRLHPGGRLLARGRAIGSPAFAFSHLDALLADQAPGARAHVMAVDVGEPAFGPLGIGDVQLFADVVGAQRLARSSTVSAQATPNPA
jgi:hypothetical protein